MKPPFVPELESPEDTKYFLHENNNSGINKSNNNKRITHRIKRTNIFFNRNDSGDNINRISFPKYCFQFNRYIRDIENNIYNELMDLIVKEIDYRTKNNTLGDESIDDKLSTESLVNTSSNRLSARTYSIEKYLNNNIFSPNSSSKLSYKTVLSDTKKSLNILPIRNLINLKKKQVLKKKDKNKGDNQKKEDKKVTFIIHKQEDDI